MHSALPPSSSSHQPQRERRCYQSAPTPRVVTHPKFSVPPRAPPARSTHPPQRKPALRTSRVRAGVRVARRSILPPGRRSSEERGKCSPSSSCRMPGFRNGSLPRQEACPQKGSASCRMPRDARYEERRPSVCRRRQRHIRRGSAKGERKRFTPSHGREARGQHEKWRHGARQKCHIAARTQTGEGEGPFMQRSQREEQCSFVPRATARHSALQPQQHSHGGKEADMAREVIERR